MVIAGSAIPLPDTPASGRAEANWPTAKTATRPESRRCAAEMLNAIDWNENMPRRLAVGR
jgi:hypothetical protein